MSHLNDYLAEKRAAVLARNAAVDAGSAQPLQLKASVKAEGRSGVRRLRIRDHQVISDSPPNFAGYDLGPSSPELQLGATHAPARSHCFSSASSILPFICRISSSKPVSFFRFERAALALI